jgi:hypothetical protein
VARLAAGGGEDSLRDVHAAHVLRAGLAADQDHLLALLRPRFGVACGEDSLAYGGARNGVDAFGDFAGGELVARELGVEHGVEEPLDVFGFDSFKCFFNCDELLVGHVHGDLECRARRALAHARLEHIEFAVLDGELHVLHIAVVALELFADALELLVNLRHALRQFLEVHGRADSGDDVFALRVQ